MYLPARYSANAVKRLGAKLAREEVLSPDAQVLYEEFIADAQARVVAVQAQLERDRPLFAKTVPRSEALEIAGRTKTRRTLSDKLRRTPGEKLPSIHDVAGVRLVADVTLLEQDLLSDVIIQSFAEHPQASRQPRVIDRRSEPQHGYRALHMVVYLEGRPIEIQLRTAWQHSWAQLMELIGDRWGREPRYGLKVIHSDPVEAARRQKVVDVLQTISPLLQSFEEGTTLMGLKHVAPSDVVARRLGMSLTDLQPLAAGVIQADPEVEKVTEQVRGLFSELGELIGADPHVEGAYSGESEGRP